MTAFVVCRTSTQDPNESSAHTVFQSYQNAVAYHDHMYDRHNDWDWHSPYPASVGREFVCPRCQGVDCITKPS